jgi:RNA polymerase sigma factor (sigma-70 family)
MTALNPDSLPPPRRRARRWDSVEVGELADGDKFARFYDYTVRLIEHHLRRQGAGYEEAQDLAQDTMLILYRKRAEIGRPVAYALATAHRVFIRHRTLRISQLEYTISDELWDSFATLDDLGEVEQTGVLRVIASLPGQQGRVLALRYDGYTPGEIAQLLDTTANNVRVTLHHARTKLRAHIDPPRRHPTRPAHAGTSQSTDCGPVVRQPRSRTPREPAAP